jgi:hypothetical protein
MLTYKVLNEMEKDIHKNENIEKNESREEEQNN